jgi:hypothetical protein
LLEPGLVYGRAGPPADTIVPQVIGVQLPVGPHLPGSADATSPPVDLWPQDFWTAEFSWAQTMPALVAMLCLIGLLAAVTVLLPVEAQGEPLQGRFAPPFRPGQA